MKPNPGATVGKAHLKTELMQRMDRGWGEGGGG